MESGGLPHPKMDWESQNLPDTWLKFQRHCELMFEGPLKGKRGKERCAYILLWIGERGRTIYSSWNLSDEENTQTQTLYQKFQDFVQPKSNPVFARYKFYNEKQNEDSIDEFVARLTLSARNCDFEEKTDEMIRDRIVFGCSSDRVREKMIEKGKELTKDKAIQIAQSYEYNKQQMAEMSSRDHDVDFVTNRQRQHGRPAENRNRQRGTDQRGANRQQQGSHQRPQGERQCGRCGYQKHTNEKDCPAMGKTCRKCTKLNHFAKMCKSDKKNIHVITSNSDNYSDSEGKDFYVHTVSNFSSRSNNAVVQISFGPQNTKLSAKIDTGSQVNILPEYMFKQINLHEPLLPPDVKLTSYTGDQLSVKGKILMNCSYKNKSTRAEFYIVNQANAPALVNIQTASALGLIQLTYAIESQIDRESAKYKIVTEFPDVFDGIGTFEGKSSIQLKENAIPVVYPVRKVPFALRDKLKSELDSMESQGIITKVTEPTDWVNALVCVEKPKSGNLRICIDPKALNEQIKRPYYPMRDISDITSQLNGAKYFSVLDATKGYYSCRLTEESSLLTTFGTMYGRFRYLRLPMGLRSSQDIFNRKMDEILEGLPGVTSIVDDVLCWGRTKSEHDENLRRLLTRAREKGLKFNPDKLVVGQTEVKYFGHMISDKGLSVDQEKVSAILSMKTPESRHELETLLGMVTYLSKFTEKLADVTGPMRSLLKKENQFIWGPEQETSFNRVKQIISQTPVLQYFDPDKPVTLQVDSSSVGIGAVCLQDGKPVAYASKSLTESQTAWAQIEKETAAILFACLKFKHYIYGKRTVVESDCKPVVSIIKKPLSVAPQRLQRLLLQLQPFDIEVIHKKGTDIPIGDALSRNFSKETYPEMFENMDTHVHTVKSLPISDQRIEQIKTETQNDEQLQAVKFAILNGWPNERKRCNSRAVDFWNHRDELAYENGLVLRGAKIVMPHTLRDDMVKAVHMNHMGVQKAISRARDIMFWPGMNKQITDFVLSCSLCEKYRVSNTKEPLYPHEVPERPWQNVSCDLFTFDNDQYMVLVDAFSHYFEIDHLPTVSSKSVIRKLKVHFSRFGSPVQIKTDNGRQFTSEEFANFANTWNFSHVTSSPNMPSSNGHAESTVKIAKRILKKAKDANTDPYMALLEFRNTPLPCGYSPSQLLMSRRLRSTLPTTPNQLVPEPVDIQAARDSMIALREKSKFYHDRNSKLLSKLNPNDPITYRTDTNTWKQGKVVDNYNDRSYVIQTKDGVNYRRNRIFLRKSKADHLQPSSNQTHPCSAKLPVSTGNQNSRPNQQLNQHYFTRKGREVRLPSTYPNNEWVK